MSVTSSPSSTVTELPPATAPTLSQGQRLRRYLPWMLLLLLLGFVGYKVFRIGQYGWRAYQIGRNLQQQTQAHITPAQLPAVRTTVQDLSTTLANLEGEVRPFRPLFRGLAWMPRYGVTLSSLPDLLIAGRELTALANEGLMLIKPDQLATPQNALLPSLVKTLTTAQPKIASMVQHAETAQNALQALPIAKLQPASLGQRVTQLAAALPILTAALRATPTLPVLLGMDKPHTYLILVQNNHELRATGGFISAVGKVTLENGQIRDLQFKDSYTYWRSDVNYPAAPAPVQRYMNIQLLPLRDANWSPDLPTTAQLVKGLYAQETGDKIAGVVTVDLRAAQLIVEALAPLQVQGVTAPVTGENFIEQVKLLWAKPPGVEDTQKLAGSEWWKQRKGFIPLLAQAALQRLQTGGVSYTALVEHVQKALAERAIQIWLAEPVAEQQLTALGWDGSLQPKPNADFLALVETNMGYNKVNAVLQRGLTYAVDWPDGPTQPGVATVAITYTHPISIPNYVCDPSPDYGENYDFLIKRCYFGYIRLYTPRGSQLIGVDGVAPDSVVARRGEKNTEVFAGYFILPVGQSHTITFRYKLPVQLTPQNYSLLVQRQSGSGPLPLKIAVAGHTITALLSDAKLNWAP